jgi:hypothetical protein
MGLAVFACATKRRSCLSARVSAKAVAVWTSVVITACETNIGSGAAPSATVSVTQSEHLFPYAEPSDLVTSTSNTTVTVLPAPGAIVGANGGDSSPGGTLVNVTRLRRVA